MSLVTDFFLAVEDAAAQVKAGGLLAYPTEAVYGLGCDPDNQAAIHRLLTVKKRAQDKGLILVASSFAQLKPYLGDCSACLWDEINASWPGPFTWLLPAGGKTHEGLTGAFSTQAVRVSAHPVVRALCDALDGPLVSTSANVSGTPAITAGEEVRRCLEDQIDGIVAGQLGAQCAPSTIRDGMTGAVLRAGGA